MNNNLSIPNTGFTKLFHISNSANGLALPFERELLLLECQIAGTGFRPGIAEIEPTLQTGAKLRLEREPQNKFDESAIAVYDEKNNHLGYVPRAKNEVLARLLDAGKTLSARLIAKQWNDAWLKLDIEIFLHE